MKQYAKAWSYIQQAIEANSGLEISLNISNDWADSLLVANCSSIRGMTSTLRKLYYLLEKDSNTTTKMNPQVSLRARQIIAVDLALQLLKKRRDDFSNERDKLRILSQTSDWVLLGLAVLNKNAQVDKAFAYAEQGKSILLLDAAQTVMAQSFGNLPDSLVQKELVLQKERGEYEAGITEKRPESERDSLRVLLNKLNLDITNFKTNIEGKFPKYAVLKHQHKEVQVQEIQALLDDKTALLEYVVGDSKVYIIYLDNKNLRLLEHTVSKTELTLKIKELHYVLSNYDFIIKNGPKAYETYAKNAHWFYEKLVASALKKSKSIEKLIIVTDGELGFLPFESFLVEQAPQIQTDYHKLHYLINDYQISYNYSTTLWKSNKDATKNNNNGQLLAMASNYDIKMDSSKIDWRLPAHQRLRALLNPLPAARKEVEVLAEEFSGFFGLDSLASEKIFKEKAGDFAVIHLAMHGILDTKGPILSSLGFTEDGDSLENNFLHAYEISKMHLNSDLVVLSACETGYGRFEKGNGIASLARAFMYAGASALIVSLWQVNDYTTSKIMKNLYDNLSNGMKKDEALGHAKLQYMKSAKGILAHPAFWSPFIMMGNTQPVSIKRKGGTIPWMIGGLVMVLFLAGAFMMSRRKREVA
jgi:CHAT domain-containing protein